MEINTVVNVSAAICSMLKNWSGMDREKAKGYILSCQVYEQIIFMASIYV